MRALLSVLLFATVAHGQAVFRSQNVITSSGPVWSVVQSPMNNTCTGGGGGAGSASCTITTTATGSSHALFLFISGFIANSAAVGTITALGNNGSDTTLTHCPGGAAQGYQAVSLFWIVTDCYYKLNTAGGTTSFTVTWNFNTTVTSEALTVTAAEISKSSGSITIDTQNTAQIVNTSCNVTCQAPTLTLGGAGDYVMEWAAIDNNNGLVSISAPYSNPFNNDTTNVFSAFAGAANQITYSRPTYTMGATDSAYVGMSVIALK